MNLHRKLTPARYQRLIQLLFALFCISIGWRFYHFSQWVSGASDTFAPRPASVEAFLPISALLSLRDLIQTHSWDMIHPAGLTVLLAALLVSFFFRKGFCGYICPFGLLSGGLNWLGRRLHLSVVPPKWLDRLLQGLKYALLAFFVWIVFVQMSLASTQSFMRSPFNLLAGLKMLHFFANPTTLTLVVLAALALLGIWVRSFWCRYLCPYGALLGLLSRFSPLHIHREEETCISCGRCRRACPAGIEVDEREMMISTECIGCLRCQSACPVEGCLTPRIGGEPVRWWLVGGGTVGMFLLLWAIAFFSGHWQSVVNPEIFKMLYQKMMG